MEAERSLLRTEEEKILKDSPNYRHQNPTEYYPEIRRICPNIRRISGQIRQNEREKDIFYGEIRRIFE